MQAGTSQKTEQRIGVVLRRETAEFTLPVTEAALSGALLRDQFDLVGVIPEPGEQPPMLLPRQALAQVVDAVPDMNGALVADASDAALEEDQALFIEPDIEIRIDDISRRFRPPTAE